MPLASIDEALLNAPGTAADLEPTAGRRLFDDMRAVSLVIVVLQEKPDPADVF